MLLLRSQIPVQVIGRPTLKESERAQGLTLRELYSLRNQKYNEQWRTRGPMIQN